MTYAYPLKSIERKTFLISLNKTKLLLSDKRYHQKKQKIMNTTVDKTDNTREHVLEKNVN